MRHVQTVRLSNDALPAVAALDSACVVVPEVPYLCLPAKVASALQLHGCDVREITLEDGQTRQVRYVSPIRVEMLGRTGVSGALVMGDQVVLGAIPLRDLDLVVAPVTGTVTANPASLTTPQSIAVGLSSEQALPRIGVAKGQFEVPSDIDSSNAEIEQMFNGERIVK